MNNQTCLLSLSNGCPPVSADHQGAPSFRPSLRSGVSRCFHLARKLAAAAALALLLALAPGASATELLVNRSFDQYGADWIVAAPATNDLFFATAGEANLHANGYLGTILWQDLNLSNVGGASGTASIALTKYSGPPVNTIAVYLEYLVTSGVTNRLLLLNPANSAVLFPPDSTVFSTNFTLPADAQSLVRLAVDKTYFGEFHAQEFSLDVTPVGGPPELGLSIVVPSEGETNTAPFLLRAGVTNLTATVSSLKFYANDALVGEGRLDPHGEWFFADGSRLSVMGGGGYESADYSEPNPGDMFFMHGTFTSQTNFSGGFQYNPSGGGMGGGAVSIVYSFDAAGLLTAAITGDAPLGVRTLSNGTNVGDTINYGFFWADATAGIYAITARAVYNSGSSATSAPVNITVEGPVPRPTLQIRQTSPTTIELSWPDDGNVYAVRSQTSLGVGSWNPVEGTVGLIGGRFVQTLSATNQTSFFRLLKLF